MKEKGIKPNKKKQIVEEGTDDCGSDLSGLGPNIILYGCDWTSDWDEAYELSLPVTNKDDTGFCGAGRKSKAAHYPEAVACTTT